jgi:hypothetical protein
MHSWLQAPKWENSTSLPCSSNMVFLSIMLDWRSCFLPPQVACLGLPLASAARVLHCVDTFAACPGWVGQCTVPGVATYCPCMCGGAPPPTNPPPTTSPTPASPTPSTPAPGPGCQDTYPACPGWVGQCAAPGVATFCPCMCGSPTPGPSSPAPSVPSPSPVAPIPSVPVPGQ